MKYAQFCEVYSDGFDWFLKMTKICLLLLQYFDANKELLKYLYQYYFNFIE